MFRRSIQAMLEPISRRTSFNKGSLINKIGGEEEDDRLDSSNARTEKSSRVVLRHIRGEMPDHQVGEGDLDHQYVGDSADQLASQAKY
jgi:hypothetical protein